MRDACSAQALQEKLINHKLDLMLSNFLPERQQQILFRIKPIAEQQLSIALLSSVVVQDESRDGTLQA